MKTKYIILLLLLGLCSFAYCGDGKGDKEFRRVYIGFSATPTASFRYLHGNPEALNGSTSSETLIGANNTNSIPEIGANLSFKLGINLTHWLSVESGIGYSLLRYRFNSNQYFPAAYINSINPADSFKMSVNEEYHYMTVPLGLRFSMGHKKVRGIITAGVDFDFLVRQIANSTNTYANGDVQTTSQTVQTRDFNTFNVSPYLGLGMDCYLPHAVVIRLIPVAQIQALKAINTQTQEEYLVNVGFNISLLFGL